MPKAAGSTIRPVRGRNAANAAIAAAVIVFAAAGWVITHNSTPAGSGTTPGYAMPTAAATTVPVSGSIVAFLGDDYTASVGAGASSKGFVAEVGAALHVTARAFAVPGGGYAKPAADGRTYADLVAAVAAARPDAVVVSGGRNDVEDYTPTLQQAATDLFAALHRALPAATIVAVAPWWGDSDQPAILAPVAAAVHAAVTAAGGTFLAGPDPLHGHPEWMADDADPNADGYAALAVSLEPRLRTLLASLR